MSKSHDLVTEFPGMVIIHQKIPAREVGRHQHDEHEFFLPLQGEITVDSAHGVVKAGPGRMLYVPPHLDHSFSSSAVGSGERVIWLIDGKTWNSHIGKAFTPCSFAMNSLAKELIFYLLIHPEARGSKHFISALVESLGDSLESAHLEKISTSSEFISGKANDARVRRAMEYMEENLSEVTLTDVAKKSGLSLRNFNRLFLKEAGLGPKEYLILRRVEKAKVLLKENKMTVTDVAMEVGYNSLSKFIETFKKITGQLPSDFKNPLRKK